MFLERWMYWLIVFETLYNEWFSPGKNERKGKLVDFKTLVVLKDEDNVFMLSTGEEVPTLLLSICGNEDIDSIELFMNLPA